MAKCEYGACEEEATEKLKLKSKNVAVYCKKHFNQIVKELEIDITVKAS